MKQPAHHVITDPEAVEWLAELTRENAHLRAENHRLDIARADLSRRADALREDREQLRREREALVAALDRRCAALEKIRIAAQRPGTFHERYLEIVVEEAKRKET